MCMDIWWNDTDTGKQPCSEKIVSQYRIVHHKSHMDWLGSDSDLCGERLANNCLSPRRLVSYLK
jgi:hypothetical protein